MISSYNTHKVVKGFILVLSYCVTQKWQIRSLILLHGNTKPGLGV